MFTKPNRRKFLATDLKEKVDIQRYSPPLPIEFKKIMSMEWNSEDIQGFYKAIESYNISSDLCGHTHSRNVYHWDGTPRQKLFSVPFFNQENYSCFRN